MATLADIAKSCNTSPATVSYVLNGKGDEQHISQTMQEMVMKTAEELNYIKSGSKLASIPKIEIYWPKVQMEMIIPSLINGMNTAVAGEAVPVDVSIRIYEPGHIDVQSALWQPRANSAGIIVSALESDLKYLSENRTRVPVVLFNRVLDGYSWVSIDQREAGILPAQHALRKGGGRIALVANPAPLYGFENRSRTIMETLQENGVDMKNSVYYCENQIDDGYELGLRMLREGLRHRVIICAYDMAALGIMNAFNEEGIQIGKDVELISATLGMPRLFARSTPPMTVVDLKIEEVTQRCMRLAIDLATRRIDGAHTITIHPSMVYRQSSPIADLL